MRISGTRVVGAALAVAMTVVNPAQSSACADASCRPAAEAKAGTTVAVNGGVRQPVETVTQFRDVTKINHVTQYKDITKTRYVDVITKRVQTTYIQPIKKVTIVTYIQPITRKKTVTTQTTMHVVKRYTMTSGAPDKSSSKRH